MSPSSIGGRGPRPYLARDHRPRIKPTRVDPAAGTKTPLTAFRESLTTLDSAMSRQLLGDPGRGLLNVQGRNADLVQVDLRDAQNHIQALAQLPTDAQHPRLQVIAHRLHRAWQSVKLGGGATVMQTPNYQARAGEVESALGRSVDAALKAGLITE